MHQFHGHFSGPGKHIFCTYFMENILSGIVQHVLKSNVNFFTIYIIIGYYFVDFQHYLSAYFSVRLSWLCSYYKMAMALCCIANMFD